MNTHDSRRTFLKTLALGVAALVAAPVMKIQETFAALVDPKTDVTAKALGYVSNAKDAKDRKDKKAQCANCNYYQGGTAKTGKCQLITGGDVESAGWCRSWAAKAKA